MEDWADFPHQFDKGGKHRSYKKSEGKCKAVKVCVLVISLHTWAQQRYTVLEVAADWHELVVSRRIMQPSIARDGR